MRSNWWKVRRIVKRLQIRAFVTDRKLDCFISRITIASPYRNTRCVQRLYMLMNGSVVGHSICLSVKPSQGLSCAVVKEILEKALFLILDNFYSYFPATVKKCDLPFPLPISCLDLFKQKHLKDVLIAYTVIKWIFSDLPH